MKAAEREQLKAALEDVLAELQQQCRQLEGLIESLYARPVGRPKKPNQFEKYFANMIVDDAIKGIALANFFPPQIRVEGGEPTERGVDAGG